MTMAVRPLAPSRLYAALAIAIAALLIGAAAHASAAPSQKKAIWGPATRDGVSQFPIYADLGVGIYQGWLFWDRIAPTRPANPTDPNDPAYHWPSDIDFAVGEAPKYGMQVSLLLQHAPGWANGGNAPDWSPNNPADFADFATAAARRYPSVHLWMIEGEPNITGHFQPLDKKTTPIRYAQVLDASYGALKAVNPGNLVIGGNTITKGQIRPRDFIRRMRLPNGLPPRMDMYGHNPFSPRRPDLKKNPVKPGTADTSDLDTLTGWLDRYLHRGRRDKKLKIFISEWTIPTGHDGYLFGYHAGQKTVAEYLRRALRITRRMKRVYTLGWFYLYDEAPNPTHNEMDWGLLTSDGAKKPAYFAFKNG
jgi:hypothetical protein